ncbi:MAG: hypothetical protein HQK67_12670, partial [Desulfamplus sp.]|nr:hypothetical protein [Desulfamplus sp.]
MTYHFDNKCHFENYSAKIQTSFMGNFFLCLLSGVAIAQLISFFAVSQSNNQLAQTIKSLNLAGQITNLSGQITNWAGQTILTVPTGKALISLGDIFLAFAGAL